MQCLNCGIEVKEESRVEMRVRHKGRVVSDVHCGPKCTMTTLVESAGQGERCVNCKGELGEKFAVVFVREERVCIWDIAVRRV